MAQWIERLNEFLRIDEEPEPEFTSKGRKRKKNIIGQIGGGKTSNSGIVDVAIMQSLVFGDTVKGLPVFKNRRIAMTNGKYKIFTQISKTAKFVTSSLCKMC